jgi:hypothetical protein
VVTLGGSVAFGDTPPADGLPPDAVVQTDESARHAIDRTWLYADDARVAAPLAAIAMSSVSYTDVGSSPTRLASPYGSTYRAFAGNTAQPGGMVSVGGELGLLPRVSVMALGQMGFVGDGSGPSAGAIAGVRVSLLPPSWTHTRFVASAGYLREAWSGPVFNEDTSRWLPGNPHGDNGAWFQAAFSGDIQRLRLAGAVHGEHVFSSGRDPVDVMVQLGASYRVAGGFRMGAEYVGQDLEESFSAAAEGGARHFIGPTASMQLLSNRLTMVAGPSVGLSALSPQLLARFALAYGF